MKIYKAAGYVRLSRDDGEIDVESMSILNQKEIINQWAEKQVNIDLVDYYIDDGYSGTNFNRPGYKKLISDIENGYIDCVITKDLSRLGREHIKVDYLTECYFPEHRVRYIALNDNLDSVADNDEFVAIRSLFNEYYPRDISKKVRSVLKSQKENGNYMGAFAPYGYQKSIIDKHKLVVDNYSSTIVVMIYDLYNKGYSGRNIANILNSKNILSPSSYRKHYKGNVAEVPCWSSSAIYKILRDEVYIGNLVQNKRTKLSYKSKQRVTIDESDWIRVENTHEPIINKSVWQMVQNGFLENKYNRTRRTGAYLYSGLIYCSDCNSRMSASTMKQYGIRYRCSTYISKGNTVCTAHSIKEDEISIQLTYYLNQLVALSKQKDFEDKVFSFVSDSCSKKMSESKQKSNMIEDKIKSLKNKVKVLYDDRSNDIISSMIFKEMTFDYQNEIEDLLTEKNYYDKLLIDNNTICELVRHWVSQIQYYDDVKMISRELLVSLIDKIYVDDNKHISVLFKQIGFIDDFINKAINVA